MSMRFHFGYSAVMDTLECLVVRRECTHVTCKLAKESECAFVFCGGDDFQNESGMGVRVILNRSRMEQG